MEIHLIKQLYNNTGSYKYFPFEYCCEDLQKNPFIRLTKEYPENEKDGILDKDGMVIPYFAVIKPGNGLGDIYDKDQCFKIDFCPFCGSPIQISFSGTVDVDDLYKRIKGQREILGKRLKQVVSKKDETCIAGKLKQLDNLLYRMDTLSEYT